MLYFWQKIRFLNSNQQDSGAAFLITAFAIFGFIAFAAIVLDISMALVSQEQQRTTCEAVSLAALDAYNNANPEGQNPPITDASDAYAFRIQTAITRANEIARLNDQILSTQEDDSKPFDEIAVSTVSLDENGTRTPGPGGLLIPGRWEQNPSVCENDGECFIENTFGDTTANAFRCESKLKTPIRTIFGSVIGQDTLWITADATATGSQGTKHLMFAIDMSLSTMRDTHLGVDIVPFVKSDGSTFPSVYNTCPYEPHQSLPAWGTASRFFYYWPFGHVTWRNMALDSNSIVTAVCQQFYPSTTSTWSSDYGFGTGRPIPQEIIDSRPVQRPIGPRDPRIHYRSDYEPIRFIPSSQDCSYMGKVITDIDDPYGYMNGWCGIVDMVTPAEPYTTILDSMDIAINDFASRGNPNDLIGVVSYATQIYPFRDPPIRNYPLGTNVSILQDAFDGSDPFNRISNFLFPMDTGTNIPLVLDVGSEQLTSELPPDERHLVIISDGESNCDNNSCIGNSGKDCQWEQYYRNSETQIRNRLEGLSNDSIKVSVVMVGVDSEPETLNYPTNEYQQCCASRGFSGTLVDSPLGCHSECSNIKRWKDIEEINEEAGEKVVADNNPNFCASSPYPGPSKVMHDLVSATGGFWVPIRLSPPPESCITCSNCGTYAAQTYCAQPDPDDPEGCIPRSTDLSSGGQRQLYDPYCRTTQEQMEEFLKKIINLNVGGYRLVQ
jgi:hypothetical protein